MNETGPIEPKELPSGNLHNLPARFERPTSGLKSGFVQPTTTLHSIPSLVSGISSGRLILDSSPAPGPVAPSCSLRSRPLLCGRQRSRTARTESTLAYLSSNLPTRKLTNNCSGWESTRAVATRSSQLASLAAQSRAQQQFSLGAKLKEKKGREERKRERERERERLGRFALSQFEAGY